MKQVLFLTHRVPFPPDRGDRIRSHHLLRFLAERSEVSLGCVSQEPVDPQAERELGRICKRVAIHPTSLQSRAVRDAWSLLRGRSATEGHFWSPGLARSLESWADETSFDVILCFCSGMYRYAELSALKDLPVAVDLVDVDSQKWTECAETSKLPRSLLYRLESVRVRRLESRLSQRASRVFVISQEEKRLLEQTAKPVDARVASNGVDLGFFAPADSSQATPCSCCFVGVLDYLPNVDAVAWFVEHVWPLVRQEFPTATFDIVGRNPTPAVRRLARVDGVAVHANVPDVRPYLSRSRCVVAPLRIARGVQNKVLEAMAMGKPVIASDNALTGIAAQPQQDLLVARDASEWPRLLGRVFTNDALAETLARNARRFVETHHDWATCLSPFESLIRQAPAEASGPATEIKQSLSVCPS